MKNPTDSVRKEMDRLVDSRELFGNELFRVELERLVFLAQLEAVRDLVETVRDLGREQK
jgi:hypothetical protein